MRLPVNKLRSCSRLTVLFLLPLWATAQLPKVNTIYAAGNKPALFTAPNGKSYKIDFWKDPHEKTPAGAVAANCDDDHFSGTDRKLAKTSETDPSAYVNCASLKAIKSNLKLPGDKTMKSRLNKNSPRSAIEKKGVILNDVFLFAFKRESDNDYHLIIGDNTDINSAVLYNMEISGLPDADNPDLDNARQAFLQAFNLDDKTCMSSYAIFIDNPVPVHVEGPVFYDVDHAPGTVGPINNGVSLRPKTSWEIHPITSFSVK